MSSMPVLYITHFRLLLPVTEKVVEKVWEFVLLGIGQAVYVTVDVVISTNFILE